MSNQAKKIKEESSVLLKKLKALSKLWKMEWTRNQNILVRDDREHKVKPLREAFMGKHQNGQILSSNGASFWREEEQRED